jgi:L-alanine-DL-glutamate epimerase-like enolase superfamily enzyme
MKIRQLHCFDVSGPARVEASLAGHVISQDALAYERIWDVLYRQDRHARKGYEMMAISAVDCALWDLRGKLLGRHAGSVLIRA